MGSEVGRLEQAEPILSVKCSEPDGEIVRHIKLTELSFERLKEIWNQVSQHDVLFNDFIQKDFDSFVRLFIRQTAEGFEPTGLMWDVDDVGLLYLHNIIPFHSAQAHFVFWDKRVRGREELLRQMLEYIFREFRLRRIEVEVPLYARIAMGIVERLGFQKEGRKRKAVRWKGDWFDLNLYSILPEDLEVGDGLRTSN